MESILKNLGKLSDFQDLGLGAIIVLILLQLPKLLRKLPSNWFKFLADLTVYYVARHVFAKVASRAIARPYARKELKNPRTAALPVPSVDDFTLPTDKIFVPLALEEVGRERVCTHDSLLAKGKRLRLVGEPGSGKTSIVKRLHRDACRDLLYSARSAQFPVFVELRNLKPPAKGAANPGDWLLDHIRDEVSRTYAPRMAECFDAYARGQGLLILLDGLDEVSSTDYEFIERAVKGISIHAAELSENTTVVLTMRVQFHQQIGRRLSDAFSELYKVKGFTPSDIFTFLTRWDFNSDSRDQAIRIYTHLTDRPSLRDMCSNPLVLAMFVARHRGPGALLDAESRSRFYGRVIDELLERRRATQNEALVPSPRDADDWRAVLATVSFEHLLEPNEAANSIPLDRALDEIKERYKCNNDKARTIFATIAKDTGLVQMERPGETFRFIHLTFCEFLAGYRASGSDRRWRELLDAQRKFATNPTTSTRLVETIPFAMGLIRDDERRDDALEKVAEFKSRRLLAVCLIETKRYEHRQWLSCVEDYAAKLLSYDSEQYGDGFLDELRLFSVLLSDSEEFHTSRSGFNVSSYARTFFKDLIQKSEHGILRLIAAYASHDAAAAFKLAADCDLDLLKAAPEVLIANCDQPPFLAIAVSAAASAHHDRQKLWAETFATAALTSSAVMTALSRMATPVQLQATMPKEKATWRHYVDNNSLAGWALAVAPPMILPKCKTYGRIALPRKSFIGQIWSGEVQSSFKYIFTAIIAMQLFIAIFAEKKLGGNIEIKSVSIYNTFNEFTTTLINEANTIGTIAIIAITAMTSILWALQRESFIYQLNAAIHGAIFFDKGFPQHLIEPGRFGLRVEKLLLVDTNGWRAFIGWRFLKQLENTQADSAYAPSPKANTSIAVDA